MLCDVITTGLPHIRAGSVRPLAVTTPQRHPALPDVPTMAEAGVRGYEAASYYGLFAPSAVPPAVLATLRTSVAKVLAEADMVRKLAEQGMEPLGLTPNGFAEYVARDRRRWGEVIRSAGIRPT
jgi:tripartite-type tricarboxylate transporter receptor subunit TctC